MPNPNKNYLGSGSANFFGIDNSVQSSGLNYGSSQRTMYDKLYKANPYVGLTYNQSGWQKFLSSLGFRTDYDRWIEEAQANAAEYDAQVASIEQQNEFNSPASEASRMRAAGQNPDLLGTQGVAESASPIQDPQGMSPGVGDEFGPVSQQVLNFASGVMSAFQFATGFAKDMLSMKQMQNAVASGDVGLADSFLKFASDYSTKRAPAQPFENDEQYQSYIDDLGKDLAFNVPRQLHLNRRQRKLWSEVVSNTYFNSEDFKNLTSNWKQSASNLDDLSKTKQYIHRSRPIGSDQWSAFTIVSSELGNLANEVWKISQKRFKAVDQAQIDEAALDSDLAKTRKSYRDDATGLSYNQMKTLSEGSSFGAQWHQNAIIKAMNSTMSRISSELERQANDGDLLSAGLLLAFNIFRLSNFKLF